MADPDTEDAVGNDTVVTFESGPILKGWQTSVGLNEASD